MNLNIKASDVAAIVGRNPYKTPEDVFDSYFGLTRVEKEFHEELAKQTPEQRGLVEQVLRESKHRVIENTESVVTSLPVEVQEYVKHEIYKSNGTQKEVRTAREYKVSPDRKRYTMNIFGPVKLVGYIDGRRDDGGIVEIKNRQNRLFGRVPEYESIQMQVYMKLTGETKCTLIEQFGARSNSFTEEFDESQWDDFILPKLVDFAKRLSEFASSAP